MNDPSSLGPHWISGMWDSVKDFGQYFAGLLALIWLSINWAISRKFSEYSTKAEMDEKIARCHDKIMSRIDKSVSDMSLKIERGTAQTSTEIASTRKELSDGINKVTSLFIDHIDSRRE